MSYVIPHIVLQYAEEAAFLWLLRARAVSQRNYSLRDLAELDGRVEAHLDGLRIAGEAGWEVCKAELAWEEAGEVFAGASLAFESGDPLRIEEVLAVADQSPELARGVISALGWMGWDQAQPHVLHLLASEHPVRIRMGVGASAVHRADPGRRLAELVRHPEPVVRSRALRAAGELGRTDLRFDVAAALEDGDEGCRFWAAWAGVLLGDREISARTAATFAVPGGARAEAAADLVARALPLAQALGWWRWLVAQDAHRLAVIAAGAAADPALVPWLLERMADEALARPAGEAFSAITGADLAYENLDRKPPEGFEAGPSDDPEDEDVAMDADEDLPWPDPERVAGWWARNQGRFAAGTRYLLGAPVDQPGLLHALRTGTQRKRAAAALEIALRYPGNALFEVRARGDRQSRVLGV
ncbi:MAG TPA: TIGR02270 family protein [Longimicrobium sp.]